MYSLIIHVLFINRAECYFFENSTIETKNNFLDTKNCNVIVEFNSTDMGIDVAFLKIFLSVILLKLD